MNQLFLQNQASLIAFFHDLAMFFIVLSAIIPLFLVIEDTIRTKNFEMRLSTLRIMVLLILVALISMALETLVRYPENILFFLMELLVFLLGWLWLVYMLLLPYREFQGKGYLRRFFGIPVKNEKKL